MTCCSDLSNRSTRQASLTIALAGNPNSGKTTIFNALTGLRQKVGNYPGVTVEKKTGRCKLPDGQWASVIDLPGTYSLISRSPDERVAMEVLRGLRADTPAPDVVVVVVDASNLQRNLYLVSQLIELGRPLVVALNMTDIAERRGQAVDAAELSRQLGGVPVVPVVGHRKAGIAELKQAILAPKVAPMPDWRLPQAMREEVVVVGGALAILDDPPFEKPECGDCGNQGKEPDCEPDSSVDRHCRVLDRYHALAERLLIGDHADDLAPVTSREPVGSLLAGAMQRLHQLGVDPMEADIEAHYRWIDEVAAKSLRGGTGGPPANAEHGRAAHATSEAAVPLNYAPAKTWTERADAVLIHKVWGLLIFAGIMGALFFSLFFVADPLMGAMEAGVGALGELATPLLPEGPIADLWTDGIVAGVGGVVVFVPQIALLFLFLAILEDSGYLARAAFLMDRLLRGVGLHGKSFIPLLSSFACAIPGIMATRTIEDRRDRLATIMVVPFMSCSARLPVYILLIGTFFAGWSAFGQAGIMLSLYVLGIVAAAAMAFVFRRTLLKGQSSAFILELPTYKIPQLSQVMRTVGSSTWAFIYRAGTIIFCLSVILWAMAYYPRLPEEQAAAVAESIKLYSPDRGLTWSTNSADGVLQDAADLSQERQAELDEWKQPLVERAVAGKQLRHSISGRLGHWMEPVIEPLGYDWKMGVGLIAAFAAREVFVSQMGIVYSVGEAEDDTTDLQAAMQADTYADGSPVWTPAVAASLLVWFVLAMQCMSTVAIVRRETGGWKWPLFMIAYMNALAYVAALVTYQVGSWLMA